MRRLTVSEKRQFVESGYVCDLPVFDRSALAPLQQRFHELIEMLPAGVDISCVNNWHKANRWVYNICHSQVILDYVEELLGPNFFHWAASFFANSPVTKRRCLGIRTPNIGPPSAQGCRLVGLFDTDETSGAMRVVRGSHRLGELRHEKVDGDQFMLKQTVVNSAIDFEKVVSLNLRAGRISLHDDALIHGSPKNRSDRMRAGLTMRYSTTDAQGDLGVWPTFESYLARGVDEYQLNPVGKIPQGDGFPVRPQQASAEFA